MRKPFTYALAAVLYIVVLVLFISTGISFLSDRGDTILIPMAMLGLFVLSAAIMGFLSLSEPWLLYMENKKQEAVSFFTKMVAFFAGFVVILLVLLFLF